MFINLSVIIIIAIIIMILVIEADVGVCLACVVNKESFDYLHLFDEKVEEGEIMGIESGGKVIDLIYMYERFI
jgi:hypothetical protein